MSATLLRRTLLGISFLAAAVIGITVRSGVERTPPDPFAALEAANPVRPPWAPPPGGPPPSPPRAPVPGGAPRTSATDDALETMLGGPPSIADDDPVRSLSQRYATYEPVDVVLVPPTDLISNAPDDVRAAIGAHRAEIDACLVDAGADPDDPTVIELELGRVPTGDRGGLSVVDLPDGVDPVSAVPCLARVLRPLAFDPVDAPEALTVPVLASP